MLADGIVADCVIAARKGFGMTPEHENALALAGALDLLRPTTSEELLGILGRHATRHVEGGQPYDADAMDDDLCDLLDPTWRITWLEGEYHWSARNLETGDVITYCEGDVYPRDDTAPANTPPAGTSPTGV